MLTLVRLLSVRHLVRSPLRSLLTVTGVAVGVATLVGVAAVNRSVLDAFRSTMDTVAGKADLTVAESKAGFEEALLERVKAVPGIAHAAASISTTAPLASSPGESLFILGVDFLGDDWFSDYRGVDRDLGSLGEDLEFLGAPDRIFLTERFARDHHLKPGDGLDLVTPSGTQRFVIQGLIEEYGPAKAFGGWVGVMFLPAAQEAFGRGTKVDRIDVAAAPGEEVTAVQARLREALGPTFEIERPDRRGGTVEKMVRSFQMGLNLGSGVALLVGVFLVYNTVAIGVAQRRREIGTLRAPGAPRRWIRWLFTLEAAVLGAIGTLVGVPLGVLLGKISVTWASDAIGRIYIQVNARDLHLGATEAVLGLVLGIGGSAFAAFRPAFHASQVHPLEALRRDLTTRDERRIRPGLLIAAGASLLAAWPAANLPSPAENFPLGGYISVFLILLGAILFAPAFLRLLRAPFRQGGGVLGFPGRLAAENFARAPGRTAVPVAALAVGVSMTICIGAFVGSFQHASHTWIDQTVPADLFITSAATLGGVRNQPMSPELGPELEKIPGVDYVDRVRVFPHDVLGLRVYILSLTPEIYHRRGHPTYLEGQVPSSDQRLAGWVTISENLSRRRNLHVGDSFEVTTPTGVHTYRVAAVMIDYTSDQGTIFMDRRIFTAQFADDRVDTYELYLSDRSRLEEVRKIVTERYGTSHRLYVLSNAELRDEARKLIDSAFSLTYAMEAVAVILALLGVINTLLAAVLDRTREIGLLRAVGAARGQVQRLFSAEAAYIGITGALLGTLAGAVMGVVVTFVIGEQSTGWSFPFRMPWLLALQMGLAAAGCSVIAGLYPARRASRIDVVEALSYE